ncbi:MAG TPA: HypC/HybG/HupF family hydrogenase formation chaperone [bacterium]|nr:HypC/HybG/HupF family hydrogenase formation chaperone [bacterium]
MCRAIPHRVIQVAGEKGLVEVGGVRHWVDLSLVAVDDDSVRVGDFVLVHSGFAISVLDETAAEQTLDLIRELAAAGEHV